MNKRTKEYNSNKNPRGIYTKQIRTDLKTEQQKNFFKNKQTKKNQSENQTGVLIQCLGHHYLRSSARSKLLGLDSSFEDKLL